MGRGPRRACIGLACRVGAGPEGTLRLLRGKGVSWHNAHRLALQLALLGPASLGSWPGSSEDPTAGSLSAGAAPRRRGPGGAGLASHLTAAWRVLQPQQTSPLPSEGAAVRRQAGGGWWSRPSPAVARRLPLVATRGSPTAAPAPANRNAAVGGGFLQGSYEGRWLLPLPPPSAATAAGDTTSPLPG